MLDYEQLREDSRYLEQLSDRLWLMDDHKWALLVWRRLWNEKTELRGTLLHADYHWDGVYDLLDYSEHEEELVNANLDELEALIDANRFVKYDSFIAPAVTIGLFAAVHFYCKQDDGSDRGLPTQLLERVGCQQHIHETVASFCGVDPVGPLAFDLCLDLFNRSNMYYEGEIWSEAEIREFLAASARLIQAADVVTVSLSFGCSGTEEDTQRLAALVIPELLRLSG